MSPLLITYTAGIVVLFGQVVQLYRGAPGRHRAVGLSTAQRAMATASYLASLLPVPALPEPYVYPDLHDEAPLCPPMYPPVSRYNHSGGAGRYAHLRTDDLDARARWDQVRRALKTPTVEMAVVDLQALRVRGEVDEWIEVAA